MEKKFKLVYENGGQIKGSYSGIKGKNDADLIERAVLEGSKKPAPTPGPQPTGEIKITENGKHDVAKFATADVQVAGLVPTGEKKITENGKYDITTFASIDVDVPSGPAPEPIVKGSVIKLAGEEYRVLSANEDLTDCEVMHIGPAKLSKFSNASPSQDPSAGTTFIVDGTEKTGLKYEGSLLDQACEAFYDDLPADIKAAIIEQEVVQDMYNLNAAEGTEDFAIDNSADGGMVYRFKKINDAPVAVGARHAYAISPKTIKDYYGTTSKSGLIVAKDFQLLSWMRDAYPGSAGTACYLYYDGSGSGVGVYFYNYRNTYCVCPAFHIDLTKVSL